MNIVVCPACGVGLPAGEAGARAVRICPTCGRDIRKAMDEPPEGLPDETYSRPAEPEHDTYSDLVQGPPSPRGDPEEAKTWPPASEGSAARRRLDAGEGPLVADPGGYHRVPVGPWRRFFARGIDFWLATIASGILLWSFLPANELVVGLLTWLVWIPIEAILLATWGTTPGKWLLATRVRTDDGDRLPFTKGLLRTADVWVRGMGFGIPVITLLTMINAYSKLRNNGVTSWDASGGWAVEHRALTLRHYVGLAGAAAMTVALAYVASMPLPAADTELVNAVENAGAYFEKQGATVTFIGDVRTGALDEGGIEVLPVELDAGVGTFLYAVCDADCADLDLAVAGPDGGTIVSDDLLDAQPLAYLVPEEPGRHEISVIMYDCRIEPCAYAVGAMTVESPEDGTSHGTCFTVSPSGLVMTALHVVDTDGAISVRFADGTVASAEILQSSESHDLALLGTEHERDDYLTFAEADAVASGMPVFTIGFPAPDILGQHAKFTEGAVSALSGPDGDEALMQMTTPVQPGNSGGPLMSYSGQVVGVVEASTVARAFEAETGRLPQSINWAVKGLYAAPLLGSDAPAQLSTTTRDGAIERTQAAICAVSVGE